MADTITSPFDPQMPFPIDLRVRRQSVAQRDTISEFIRWEGMMVYVIDNQTTYQLKGGIANSQWVEIIGGTVDVLSTVLAGFTPAPNSPVTDSDTVLAAFGKLQAQINSFAPVSPTDRAGSIPGSDTDAVLFTGDLSADVNNTSLFYSDDTATNAPAFADTDGGVATITGSNGAKRQIWFGRNGILGIRGSGGTGVYDPWVQIASMQSLSDYQLLSEKGVANGYPPLNASGVIPSQYMPPIALTFPFVVGSQAEMLALDAQVGDVAIRTDISTSFILQSAPPTTLSNWVELLSPGAGVQSVNGLTGTVQLDLSFTDGDLLLTGSTPPINLDSRYYTETESDQRYLGFDQTLNNRTETVNGLDLNTVINCSVIRHDNSSINQPVASQAGTLMSLVHTVGANYNGPQIWISDAVNNGFWFRAMTTQTYEAWQQLATVDMAVQNLQSVTTTGLNGNVTTTTIQHAPATNPNNSLTGENLGFAMGWNGNTLEFDWGNTQIVGGHTFHFVDLNPNESLSFGSPLGTGDPLFHLSYGATPADSEWQLRTTAASATDKAVFTGNQNITEWRITDASNLSKAITISQFGSGIGVLDGISQVGLVNNGDYEANFVARSLVTKQYIDGIVEEGTWTPSLQDGSSTPITFTVVEANYTKTFDMIMIYLRVTGITGSLDHIAGLPFDVQAQTPLQIRRTVDGTVNSNLNTSYASGNVITSSPVEVYTGGSLTISFIYYNEPV